MKAVKKIGNLGAQNSIFNKYISEIRDAVIQQDTLRFRFNMERLGAIFAYEISRTMEYETQEIVTSLGIAEVPVLKQSPVLGTIDRKSVV